MRRYGEILAGASTAARAWARRARAGARDALRRRRPCLAQTWRLPLLERCRARAGSIGACGLGRSSDAHGWAKLMVLLLRATRPRPCQKCVAHAGTGSYYLCCMNVCVRVSRSAGSSPCAARHSFRRTRASGEERKKLSSTRSGRRTTQGTFCAPECAMRAMLARYPLTWRRRPHPRPRWMPPWTC